MNADKRRTAQQLAEAMAVRNSEMRAIIDQAQRAISESRYLRARRLAPFSLRSIWPSREEGPAPHAMARTAPVRD
jgi:hypothetical protein